MLKKVCFAILFIADLFSLQAFENDPFPKIEETVQMEKQGFRYASLGAFVIVPTVNLGFRTKKGGQGNDFSLSYSCLPLEGEILVAGGGIQYARLFYLDRFWYCGLGSGVNYFRSQFLGSKIGAFIGSGTGSVGYQFQTQRHTHFVELKGNIPLVISEHGRFDLMIGFPIPSLTYGISF